jgi:hypothetical protein
MACVSAADPNRPSRVKSGVAPEMVDASRTLILQAFGGVLHDAKIRKSLDVEAHLYDAEIVDKIDIAVQRGKVRQQKIFGRIRFTASAIELRLPTYHALHVCKSSPRRRSDH